MQKGIGLTKKSFSNLKIPFILLSSLRKKMLKNSGLSENLLESCRQSKRSEYLTGRC